MRILILSDINSAHTRKWVRGLCGAGIEISLFSLSAPQSDWYSALPHFTLGFAPVKKENASRWQTKLGYTRRVGALRKTIREFSPDIVHAHYATSYGLLSVLAGFRPLVISVWGADVYDFPKQNFSFKRLLKYILSKPDLVCSTSNCMAAETRKYTNVPVVTVPFGLDTRAFAKERHTSFDPQGTIVIGSIKALTPKYGTDYLIRAFALLCERFPDRDLRLLLVGTGSHDSEYWQLAKELGISGRTEFTGSVEHEVIAKWHAKIDIFVGLSVLDSESFGVSLVEAMASGAFVVASDVDGYREVLENGNELGLMVPRRSVEAAADAIGQIISNPEAAKERARRAFDSVHERYEWSVNLQSMIGHYQKLLGK